MYVDNVEIVMEQLGSYNPVPHLNNEGTWGMVSCPLAPETHGGGRDVNPSFAVSVGPGVSYCKCFSCGFNGGAMALVRRARELAIVTPDIANDLLDYITAQEHKHGGETSRTNQDVPQVPAALARDLGQPHSYWTHDRGLDVATQRAWNLGYSEEKQRALIPFYDGNGVLVGIVGRDVTGESPQKYFIYPQRFDRASYLFGEHRITGAEEAIFLVEGYMDAVSASRFVPEGIGVVALGSASPSTMQLRKLAMISREVIIGLDNDGPGTIGAQKAIRTLGGKLPISTVDYGEAKDADEIGDGISEVIANRRSNLLDGLVSSFATLT